jgi:hypothetical protein
LQRLGRRTSQLPLRDESPAHVGNEAQRVYSKRAHADTSGAGRAGPKRLMLYDTAEKRGPLIG